MKPDKKIEKKRAKLVAHIQELETKLRTSLAKKVSATAEIDVPGMTRKITELNAELAKL